MRAIFQEKGKKGAKKDKIFENLCKNVQYLKVLEKGQLHAPHALINYLYLSLFDQLFQQLSEFL